MAAALMMFGAACGDGSSEPPPVPRGPLFTLEDINVDALPRCESNEQCGEGQRCEPRYGRCVECLFDVECGSGEVCESRRCVSGDRCTSDASCEGDKVGRTHCDMGTGRCVACANDAQCGAGEVCDGARCVEGARCVNSLDCANAKVCDRARDLCVQCVSNADCGEDGVCFENTCRTSCASDLECVDGGGLCATQYDFCVECVEDEDCPGEYHCDEGTCQLDVCAQTESACAGASMSVCRTDGRGFASIGCQEQQATCAPTDAGVACQPWVCAPRSITCDAATGERVVCSNDGLSVASRTACASGTLCVAGTCTPQVCTPNAAFCQGNTPRQCNATGTSFTSGSSCSWNSHCAVDGGNAYCASNVCSPGNLVCINGFAGTCDANGAGLVSGGTDCAASNSNCRYGECVPRICTPNETKCTGTDVYKCSSDGSGWTLQTYCAYASKVCRVQNDVAQCVTLACTPGASVCDGTRLATCNAEGTGFGAPYTECTGFANTCVSGECRPSVCTANAYYCEDDRLMRCNTTGTGATTQYECGGSSYCDAVGQTCRQDVCAANTMGCNGNATAMCNLDGSGFVGQSTPCAQGTTCSNGTCMQQTCVPGARRCSAGYGGTLYECASTGLSEQPMQTCYSWYTNSICSVAANGCIAPVCNPGQTRCAGGRVETCASDRLTWATSNDCVANQQLCVSSACVAQQIETIGYTNASFAAADALRGHYVQVTSDRLLIRFEAYLRITNGQTRPLTWVVYEAQSQVGPYTPIAQVATTANGNGAFQWYGSDPLNVTLRAGRWYAIGVLGNGVVEYHYYNYTGMQTLGFGNVWSALYENGATVPATLAGESRATLYLQRLTTGAAPP